jgi:predicted HTH domain antitoxin
MSTVSFDVPDDLLKALKSTPEAAVREIRLAAALYWCGRGEISTSTAAQLAGRTYAEFLEEATRRKVDLYHYDIEKIREEAGRPLPEGINTEAIKQDIARAQSRRG